VTKITVKTKENRPFPELWPVGAHAGDFLAEHRFASGRLELGTWPLSSLAAVETAHIAVNHAADPALEIRIRKSQLYQCGADDADILIFASRVIDDGALSSCLTGLRKFGCHIRAVSLLKIEIPMGTSSKGTCVIRVKRVWQADPVHAKASNPNVDFIDVVGLNIGGSQSPAMADIDLVTDINLGVTSLQIGAYNYELSLRCIRIILDKENAAVQSGTYYKMILQQGVYEVNDTAKKTATHSAKGEGSVTGELSAGVSAFIPSFVAKIVGKGSANAEMGRVSETASQTRIVATLDFVYPSGLDSWIAGGSHGDRRRHDTKDLRGEIISGRDGDTLTPLCGLEAMDPRFPVTGRIIVRTGLTGFVLNGTQRNEEEAALTRLFQSLKDNEAPFIERRVKAERDLRKRVAGLAMVKNNRKPNQTELDLAIRSFIVEPEL
jgi:hypothetical protein